MNKQLRRNIIVPLEQLSHETNALTNGNYTEGFSSSAMPTAFKEVKKLSSDFQRMSINLNKRQAALIQSEQRFRGLFKRVPVGLFRTTLTGQIVNCNDAIINMLGYINRSSLLNVNFANIFHKPSPDSIKQQFVDGNLKFSNHEIQLQRYDNKIIWVTINIYLVDDNTGKHYEGSINDITQRKHAEIALNKAKKELETQVEIRTHKLLVLNKELEKLSSLDGLTGIANRRYLDEYLEQEWYRAIRSGSTLAVIMLDLDDFKYYNDFYGHQAGDHCLQQIAKVVASTVKRSSDLVARYGGEEFVVVSPDTDLDSMFLLAETIRQKVISLHIPHEKTTVDEKYVTISLGVSAIIPQKGIDMSLLIKTADEALYKAKEQGRNQVCKQE